LQNEDFKWICTVRNARKILNMVHTKSYAGFLQGTEFIYKAGSASGKYHGQMNSIHFERWIRENTFQDLSPPQFSCSILNAPYDSVKADKAP
jgi:hypothetical protein